MYSLLTQSRSRFPAAEHHDIFTSLVDDMILTLLDHAEVDTLIRLRSTGHIADAFVSGYFTRKLTTHLSRFVKNTDHFLHELEICSAVISGSTALAILLRLSWKPEDLDVYAPKDLFFHVVGYLMHVEGYSVAFVPRYSYHVTGNIRAVARLTRSDGQRVDVIQSTSNSPLLPLAAFWNTAVMNYITPSSFCIAYPHLTDAHRGLISTADMHPMYHQGVPLPTQPMQLVEKYRARGFDLRLSHVSWARELDVNAACAGVDSACCPLTIRYFGDRYCVTGSLNPVRQPSSFRVRINLVTELTAAWWRGGQTCGGECAAEGGWVLGDSFSCRRSMFDETV